jgi:hypothetical protein
MTHFSHSQLDYERMKERLKGGMDITLKDLNVNKELG